MKKKDLQNKEFSELNKMLADTKKELLTVGMEVKIRKHTNIKKAFELRRRIAILSGMVSGRHK